MEIKLIQTQKALSPTQIRLAHYVINPYRGCEFGCLYCYANENKNLKDSSGTLSIKINYPEALEKELLLKKPKRVLLGSTTECFQYQETKYKITQKILEILAKHKIPCTILTKSALIYNYLDILAQNKENKVYFTLNFSSDKIIQTLEANSSPLAGRLLAIKGLIAKKIPLRIHIGPFIPFISSIKDLFSIFPEGVKEIDIELYHHKMGNFSAILESIENNFGKDVKEKINRIYSSKEIYDSFAKALKDDLKALNQSNKYTLYFLAPEYNGFYSQEMDYETTIL